MSKKNKVSYVDKWVSFIGNRLALFYITAQHNGYIEYTDNTGTFWERIEYIECAYDKLLVFGERYYEIQVKPEV